MAKASKRPASKARNPKKPGKKSAAKPAKAFPWRDEDTKAMEDGAQVERARYWHQIRSNAKNIVTEAGDDEEKVDDLIREAADSAVTYTHDAWRIAWISDSSDAIGDTLGDSPANWGADGVTDAITKIAYFAFEADLRQTVEAFQNEGVPED